MKTRAWAISIGLAVFFAGMSAAQAEVSDYIPVGGVLSDTAGEPLTGYYDVIFAVYGQATGGTALWSETRTGTDQLQVTDGLFTAYLGEIAYLDFADLIVSPELWLGITVGTDSEMNRIRIGTVPFAMEAQYCRQMVGVECEEGQFLRGWDDDTGDPICEPDQSVELADGGVFEGVLAVYAGTGLLSDGVPNSPTLSADFGTTASEVAAGNHTHADMATQTWVSSQNYATQAWVGTQGYATQTWASTAFQEDIASTSCTYGIASIADNGAVTCAMNPDTNAATLCSGTSTYLDGEGNCDTIDLSGFQPDIEDVTCQFGIATIDDEGLVTCADNPSGDLPADGIATVSNGVITDVLTRTYSATDTPITVTTTSSTGESSYINVANTGTIRSITTTVNITHADIGELTVRLYSPEGTMVTLHNHGDSGTANLAFTYPTDRLPAIGSMDDFVGEAMNGTWTFQVIDTTTGNIGTLNSWSITIEYLADAEVNVDGTLSVGQEILVQGVPLEGLIIDSSPVDTTIYDMLTMTPGVLKEWTFVPDSADNLLLAVGLQADMQVTSCTVYLNVRILDGTYSWYTSMGNPGFLQDNSTSGYETKFKITMISSGADQPTGFSSTYASALGGKSSYTVRVQATDDCATTPDVGLVTNLKVTLYWLQGYKHTEDSPRFH